MVTRRRMRTSRRPRLTSPSACLPAGLLTAASYYGFGDFEQCLRSGVARRPRLLNR